ncbi:hypothetical protein ATANTOWER_030844 [Ataeniobius toweri]|uniref:Uncharacterized protein n=1 Tax=Ataeniobius toweri TaxID=208326 RepID=A0ABU7A8Q0_9TELE|nr:hypothetical protein [Ataeniobius toweri]
MGKKYIACARICRSHDINITSSQNTKTAHFLKHTEEQSNNWMDTDGLIEFYFRLGRSYKEILRSLASQSINLSCLHFLTVGGRETQGRCFLQGRNGCSLRG